MGDENKSVFDDWDAQFASLQAAPEPVQPEEPGLSLSELSSKEQSIRSRIADLDKKMAEPNSAYKVKNQQGQDVIDYMALERDRNERMRLRDQLDDVREQNQAAKSRSQQWGERLTRAASNFAKGNMGRVSESQRSAVGSAFRGGIERYLHEGVMNNPAYQNEQAIQGMVSTAFDLAVGSVVRSSWKSDAPSEAGNGQAPRQQVPERTAEDEELDAIMGDERARKVFEANTRGKRESLADQMRRQRSGGGQ